MPNNMFDYGDAGSRIGKALAGALSGDAYQQGYESTMPKLAQAAMAGAHANLYNQQAEELRRRAQYQSPEFSSRIGGALAGLNDRQAMQLGDYQARGNWGESPDLLPDGIDGPPQFKPNAQPTWYNPQVEQRYNMGRAAHLASLAGTGNTNAEQMAHAFERLIGQGRIDAAMANPNSIPAFGAAMAASQGKGQFHQGTNGVMNQFTGSETLNDVGRSAAMENRAQAGNASASAAQHLAQRDLTRSKIGQPQVVVGSDGQLITVQSAPSKPMPAAALKMQQEELDALATGSAMNDQLGKFDRLIESGKLALGPVENIVSRGKNFAGASSENSRNFASFQATLEKIRNDSLRLNKGVQTEGDAVRAWDELLANINDPKLVRQRLQEIQAINDRATEIRRMNIQNIRQNYSAGPLDTSGYVQKPAGQAPAAQAVQIDRNTVLRDARSAIAAGADRAAVIQRLKQMGIESAGL